MNLEELDNAFSILKDSDYVAFDFETRPNNQYPNVTKKEACLHHKMLEIEGLALRSEKLEPIYIDFDMFPRLYLAEKLHDLFSQDSLFIAHNMQFDAKIADYFFGARPKRKFCTLIGYWYLDENVPKDAKTLGKKHFDIDMIPYDEAKKLGPEEFEAYAKRDAEVTYRLYFWLKEHLEKNHFELVSTLEMDFLDVLIDMTLYGTQCDIENLKHGEMILSSIAIALEAKIYRELGEFNIGSSQQLCEKIYGIKIKRSKAEGVKLTKVDDYSTGKYAKVAKWNNEKDPKKKAPSTDEKALSKLDTPAANLIKEYRGVRKLLDTYAIGYQRWIIDGKIHPTFNNSSKETTNYGTVTGRLCVHPDTLVEMPRDLAKYPNGVPLRDIKVGDIVYSFDVDRELCLKKVLWVGPTQKKNTIIIHTDDGPPLKISEDHLVRKYSGDWSYAKNLKVGDRLLCMPTRGFSDGYAYFFPHSKNRRNGVKSGGKVKEHRFIALNGKPKSSTCLVHHKDGNKLNNSLDNLELLPDIARHKIKHSYKGNPELLEEAVITGYGKTGHKLSEETLRKYKSQLKRNHRVTKIEYGPEELLWDLEIEDTNTFIGNDVALHNSCAAPNMMNLPRAEAYGWWIRDAIYAKDGYCLIVADEAQLEIRVLAHFSKDENLIKAIESGEDIHLATAKVVFGKDDISKEERSKAKTINFAIIYGEGDPAIAEQLKISVKEATEFRKQYFAAFPGIKKFVDSCVLSMKTRGYITTIIGRKRRIPEINSSNWGKSSRAERQTPNAKIQGTASDIVKVAMLHISEEFKEKSLDAHILLQVHDEIVVECKEGIAEEVSSIIKKHMEVPFGKPLRVPLEVKPTVCRRWSEGK